MLHIMGWALRMAVFPRHDAPGAMRELGGLAFCWAVDVAFGVAIGYALFHG